MVICVFFLLAICAIRVFAASGNSVVAVWAIAVVPVAVAILDLNHEQCPLGKIAERYTDNRAVNFDIYHPAWLAGRTKLIFGSLLGGGIVFTALRQVAMSP